MVPSRWTGFLDRVQRGGQDVELDLDEVRRRMSRTFQFMAIALGVVVLSAIGSAFVSVPHPAAQDFEEEDVSDVSEAELNLYIDVYSAMQADHGMTIDQALVSVANGMELTSFRDLERRIERQERLIERVRQVLVENAKAKASSVAPTSRQKAED